MLRGVRDGSGDGRRDRLGGSLTGGQRRRVHVHRHLVAVTGRARIQLARQRALRHHPQRIRAKDDIRRLTFENLLMPVRNAL